MPFGLKDIQTLEEDENASMLDEAMALQRAINSGSAWSMQGSYGRAMMRAIEDGRCLLGRVACRDYYGNLIPSRDQVQANTKGSYEFVKFHMGAEYADKMKEID